jgi:hypothetical protein
MFACAPEIASRSGRLNGHKLTRSRGYIGTVCPRCAHREQVLNGATGAVKALHDTA